ncbi:thermonuclease family protein [Thauera sp. WH-1]|uniref:thermonuclease family protein n=1 Tax=Thauera sp. WH-1 TaxID=3398230 RepID=UPI0039FBC445
MLTRHAGRGLFFAAALLTLIISDADARTLTGRIVSIADGDTVTLLDGSLQQHKIRLAGIDAPERRQAFGNRSRQHLAGLVFDKHVIAYCPKTDRYRRAICTIEVGGIDANLAQVKAGMAWHYKAYERDQRPADRRRYAQAEARARENRVGLWADRAPVAPWEFRKTKR